MSEVAAALDHTAPIVLAREADFALGAAGIHPSTAEVTTDAERIRLQPRVMQVLVALARAKGKVVSRDELIASCWGGLAIGDDAIQRCIARLRTLADVEVPGAFTIQTLPRIGYRLDRGDAASIDGPSTNAAIGRWPTLRRIGLAGLPIVATALGGWFVAGPLGWSSGGRGVVVMPLEAPLGDISAREFAEGVTAQLAHFLPPSQMRIVSPDRTAGLSGAQREAVAVGTGAQFALDGDVRRDGAGLNLAVTLADLPSHTVLWSAAFARPAAQSEPMQAQVAAKVAQVLGCAREAEDARAEPPTVALYVRACERREQEDDLGGEARDLLRQVVQRTPGFARAWSELAVTSAIAAQTLPPDQAAKARAESLAAGAQALRLDPRQGGAYVAGVARATSPGERRMLALRGLSVDPDNAELNDIQAYLMGEIGREAEAEKFARRAFALRPYSPALSADLARHLVENDGLVEAEAVAERAAQIWPDDEDVRATRLVILGYWGDPDRALAVLADPKARPYSWESAPVADFRRFVLARKSADKAQIGAYSRDALARMNAGKDEPSHVLRLVSTLGATDAGFAAADRAVAEGSLRTDFLFTPSAESMRRDPRFMPLAARAGLVAVWRASGHWPDFCAAADRPYDCVTEAARTR